MDDSFQSPFSSSSRAGVKVGSSRKQNYSNAECTAITKAMLAAKNDPLKGSGQKRDDFNITFFTKFQQLQRQDWPDRSMASLLDKYTEIKRDCSKFNAALAFIKRLPKQSGATMSEEEEKRQAFQTFTTRSKDGKDFNYYSSYLLLADQPMMSQTFGQITASKKVPTVTTPNPALRLQEIQIAANQRTSNPSTLAQNQRQEHHLQRETPPVNGIMVSRRCQHPLQQVSLSRSHSLSRSRSHSLRSSALSLSLSCSRSPLLFHTLTLKFTVALTLTLTLTQLILNSSFVYRLNQFHLNARILCSRYRSHDRVCYHAHTHTRYHAQVHSRSHSHAHKIFSRSPSLLHTLTLRRTLALTLMLTLNLALVHSHAQAHSHNHSHSHDHSYAHAHAKRSLSRLRSSSHSFSHSRSLCSRSRN